MCTNNRNTQTHRAPVVCSLQQLLLLRVTTTAYRWGQQTIPLPYRGIWVESRTRNHAEIEAHTRARRVVRDSVVRAPWQVVCEHAHAPQPQCFFSRANSVNLCRSLFLFLSFSLLFSLSSLSFSLSLSNYQLLTQIVIEHHNKLHNKLHCHRTRQRIAQPTTFPATIAVEHDNLAIVRDKGCKVSAT